MAVVFDQIIGNVRSNGQPEPGDQEQPAAPSAPDIKPAMIKRAMCQVRQRQARLRAS